MKTLYISPVFKNADGTSRKLMIAAEGLKTHKARDAAVMKMQALGGISAPDTPETRKLMATIIRSKRKIEKNGWFATEVK
jgi:hypothetical protein